MSDADEKSKAYKRWLYRSNQHPKKVTHATYYVDENDELQIKEEEYEKGSPN
jgi:hypothetical protein